MRMRFISVLHWLHLGILYFAATAVDSLKIDKCPVDWMKFESSCYSFHKWTPLPRDKALFKCGTHGGGLVSVTNRKEHNFLVRWLQLHDRDLQTYYTSGVRVLSHLGATTPMWQATGEVITDELLNSIGYESNQTSGAIVYFYSDAGYQFGIVDPSEILPFICEVPLQESYRIVQSQRDYDYGLLETDIELIEKGPHFIVHPFSTIVVGRPASMSLECVATGKPHPTYTWWKGKNFDIPVDPERNPRYAVTNGKLTIKNPIESKDSNRYQCRAENKFGIIISDVADISFGALGQFSNVQVAPVRAMAYQGVAIECPRISYNPAIAYQWYKNSATQFVRPKHQTYIFISQNGKLYFSEVTSVDEGQYYCIAILTGRGQHAIGITQPPTRTSLPISLMVRDQAPLTDWGPEIQDEFIAVFPNPPLRRQHVRMECFAYGSATAEFRYSWEREGKQLPKNSVLMDHNRVLLLREATLDNQGVYTCTVRRGTSAQDQQSIDLKLGSKPYFIAPIGDQHVDLGAHFTWHCDVRSNPASSFRWYRDGHALTSNPDESIVVINNVLKFSKLDPKLHDGMYQCAATNVHGTSFSEGQLRVLAIAPTFVKNPMQPETRAPNLGNLTLSCRPDAAPMAEITWFRGGAELPQGGGVYEQRLNGDLHVIGIQQNHNGRYTCKAVNQLGEAEDSSYVTVAEGTYITHPPKDEYAVVNATVFFYCVASHAPRADILYTWHFDGRLIEPKLMPAYDIVQENAYGKTGLYIQGVTIHHMGIYECRATTTINSDSRSAFLTVIAPPAEPAGAYVEADTVTETSVTIRWTETSSNGRRIQAYVIESQSQYDDEDHWEVAIAYLSVYDAKHAIEEKRLANVTGLNPYCPYRFRVIAVNEVGKGPPSVPTSYVQMLSAAPLVYPVYVGGGGGSVGTLRLAWEPMHINQHGGPGFGYAVYWRKKDSNKQLKDIRWREKIIKGNKGEYFSVEGADNYYLEYEVKVQAFNNVGYGPNSTAVTIMSAEDLPATTATDVRADGFNGTAMEVTWHPVADTRETAKGKILGYQVNYWHEEDDPVLHKMYIRYEGQVDNGIVIGLKSDNFYYFTVQVYNSAGLGPISEFYFQETLHSPAKDYPPEVRVYSRGGYRVEVWWRGVSVFQGESAIDGYVIYYWPAHEHYRTATKEFVDGNLANREVIRVEPGVVYALRVGAFSAGGLGKRSVTQYFTLEGNNIIMDYDLAQTVESFVSASNGNDLKLSTALTWTAFILLIVLSA